MRYRLVANAYEAIEATTSRLGATALLAARKVLRRHDEQRHHELGRRESTRLGPVADRYET